MWDGVDNSKVTPDILKAASKEVSQAALKKPFRIYGTFCAVLTGHTDAVNDAEFSSDGKRIVTAGADKLRESGIRRAAHCCAN